MDRKNEREKREPAPLDMNSEGLVQGYWEDDVQGNLRKLEA